MDERPTKRRGPLLWLSETDAGIAVLLFASQLLMTAVIGAVAGLLFR